MKYALKVVAVLVAFLQKENFEIHMHLTLHITKQQIQYIIVKFDLLNC